MNEHTPIWLADLISAIAILGTILGYLPYVAALAGFIWYLIQIWESKTMQRWYTTRRARVHVARLIALRKEASDIERKINEAEREEKRGEQ